MTLREFRNAVPLSEWRALTRAGIAEQTLDNAAYNGVPLGAKACKRLVAIEPRLTLAELRPDIWGTE